MKHVERVETLPRPIFDSLALALFGQLSHSDVGSGGQEFVIRFVGHRQPFRGSIREDSLQKRGAPPLIKICIFSEKRLEKQVDGRPARRVKKPNFWRIGVGDSVPIFQTRSEEHTSELQS